MKSVLIGVSQRVAVVEEWGERRDALDQRWSEFLFQCGLVPIPIPNHLPTVRLLLQSIQFDGILLTGGNNLVAMGGDAPERDATELLLLEHAKREKIPLIGVCRGMQVLQHSNCIPIAKIPNHVATQHEIEATNGARVVNSYHQYGTRISHLNWAVTATAKDGIVEAIQHVDFPFQGIMWHPERCDPIVDLDRERFRNLFGIQNAKKSAF
jgi:N5-(cytidine 5'-diphosphoramidyl)-L-glutamine hydrolase